MKMSCESLDDVIQPDKIEFGSWALQRILGSGAFGKVLLLKNEETEEYVALKKCHSHTSSSSAHCDQWKREISILHQLKHPGIISVLPVPEDLEVIGKDVPVLCMEYCSGGDLRRVLNKPENACGLPEKDVLQLAGDISSALVYLHSLKIVHRDLKPENIVIQHTGGKNVYKLADLGFAKDLNKQSLCHTLVGTLQYVAPELFTSEKYTNTADYWSLGLVVHECITGVRPFLPGYPTVQWVNHIEKKSREDICVYVRPNGELIYTTSLLKENHLTSVIEKQFEEWLKLMLDWDPARRGRDCVGPSQIGQIVAFDYLERILKTCVLSIFWVDELITLSYAIDDETSIETIQEWVYRDTSVKRQNQLFISPRGYPPDPLKGASQLLGGKEISITCLFSKQNDDRDNRLAPAYPEFLEAMLADPKKETEYRAQKRMWAQSVFFIQQQDFLYRRLLYSLKLLSTHMTVRSALLKQQIDHINGAIRHAESCHELFTRSLQLDVNNYQLQSQRGGLPSSTLCEKWKQEELLLQMTLRELETRYTVLDQTIREVLRNSNITARAAANFLSKPDASLETLHQSAMELYGDLLKRSNDRKQEVDNNLAMTKVIVRTLKARQQLCTDCFTQIRVVEKYTAGIENLSPQLLVIKTEIDQFQQQMLHLQSQRQNEVWALLERAVTLWQRTSMMNDGSQSYSLNSSDPSIVTIPSLGFATDTSQETMVIIRENQSLRYKIQDLLSQRLSATSASSQSLDLDFYEAE